MPEAERAAPRDARRASAASERRMRAIDAFIDLVLEGHLPPSTDQIAARAGISMATLFRYFETLDEMRRDAGQRVLERFPLLHLPDAGEGGLSERIERFAALRVELWERVHLLARLQRSAVLKDAGAAEMVDRVRRIMADEIRVHFAPELSALTAARRDDVVATIASLTSVESWEQLRETYGRSPLQARRAWAHAIEAILARTRD